VYTWLTFSSPFCNSESGILSLILVDRFLEIVHMNEMVFQSQCLAAVLSSGRKLTSGVLGVYADVR
jgi:hypothetical protein